MCTGWTFADPLVSILIAALIGWNALKIVTETVKIPLEDTPRGVSSQGIAWAIRHAMAHPVDDAITSLVATSFGDLNQLLVELVVGAKEVLADNFCGAYLQGSFAVGDADAHSDVDFIIATKDDLTPKQEAELQTLHQALYAQPTPWAQHLEGSYIPREVLRRPDPVRRPLLYLDNGATEFRLDNHDNTVVVRWSLRERGVVLAGPDPRELVDPITADELRAEVRWALGHWRAWFRSLDSINRRALAVAVLSHARILHTLAIGEVSSKRVAGEWALDTLDPEWAPLIRWALEDRPVPWTKVHHPADPARLRRTLQFIDYAARWAAEH